MAEPDPYRVLGVSKNAADAEIKRAFRKKARQFHPDRNPDNASAEAKFKQVQAAYDKIGTAQGRREYDQQQQMANMFGGGQGGMGGAGFEDMIGQMFGGGGRRGGQFSGMGGNPFGSQGRGRQQQQSQRPKGRDINVSIDITTEQAAEGGTFSFTFKRLKPNPAGTMEAKSVTLQAQLKAGVTHGTIKRMKGQGNDHPQGDSGDVILTVRIDAGEGRFWDGDVLVQEVKTPYSLLHLAAKSRLLCHRVKKDY